MLTEKPTKELISEWKKIYEDVKDILKPNKRKGEEIVQFLESNYFVTCTNNKKIYNVVYGNLINNSFFAQKLDNKKTIIKTYIIKNCDKNKEVYLNQDAIFKGIEIIVGIEINTSFIFVEGSSYIYDQLVAFAGLDEYDIQNFFLVAQYVECMKKFHKEYKNKE